ncbi:hypothetical protein UY3_06238 [Chelonia mydas]|uniref:Uncharacterized protein n=1 Tax=Chelonia mydas TaxID=8469 RepID=M7BH66_CHEMY|nr:hypothetical protein UY3_06238 [Chelonia mydas]
MPCNLDCCQSHPGCLWTATACSSSSDPSSLSANTSRTLAPARLGYCSQGDPSTCPVLDSPQKRVFCVSSPLLGSPDVLGEPGSSQQGSFKLPRGKWQRLCSLRLKKLTVLRELDKELSSVLIAVKIQRHCRVPGTGVSSGASGTSSPGDQWSLPLPACSMLN